MALAVKIFCSVAIMIQTITCQGIGNTLNAGFNSAPYGNKCPNGLVSPGLVSPGLGNPSLMGLISPGLGGQGLVGNGLTGPGLKGAGLVANGLVGNGLAGNGVIGPGLKGPGLVGNGLIGNGLLGSGGPGLAGHVYSSGGSFAVTSTSSVAPTGVSILAENLAIEGPLSVGGQLPFLGTVGVQGTIPASGSGTVSYGCGNGNLGITSDVEAHGLAGQYGVTSQYGLVANQYGPSLAGLGSMSGSNMAGYNPGFNAGLNAPVQLGPSLVGNRLNGGLANLAGAGLNDAVLK